MDNTVGSLLQLSSYQEAVLLGTLLGDGCLTMGPAHQNARLQFGQGIEEKAYVFWKYEVLKDWFIHQPILRTQAYHKDTSRKQKLWRCESIRHPVFTECYYLFYPNGEKIVPQRITEILRSPISLAVWYMDDGTKLEGKGAYFSTQNFTLEDHKKLVCLLQKNFCLSSKPHKQRQRDGKYYRLYIPKKEFEKLKALIEPHILPCFQYKLLDHGNKPRRDF